MHTGTMLPSEMFIFNAAETSATEKAAPAK